MDRRRSIASALALIVFALLALASKDTKRGVPSEDSGSSAPASAPSRPASEDVRVTAAWLFTSRYERSNLSGWNIRARAAGADCGVLLVDIGTSMDDAMIDNFHYSSNVYEGGVEHFYKERTFRGVVYRDASGHGWRYGLVGEGEATSLNPC